MKSYTLTVTEDDNKKMQTNQKADGFSKMEIVAALEFAKQRVLDAIKDESR